MEARSPNENVLNLGKYTLLEKLGEGHLGPVYRGFDRDADRAVAVRILCSGIRWDSKIEELYSQHCRTVSSLAHPNVASILDSGIEGQFHFIVMESLGGTSLQNLMRERPDMTAEATVALMIQVAEGLGYAHKNCILHRDLTPAKIHVTADGTVKVRDFSIAHVLRNHLPHPAIRWGTPIYLSPEQVQQKDGDPRSDIFSTGTIFYQLLTHHHPFYDKDGNKALDNILMNTQIPTFELFPDVPPGIWPILKTCLEKNPKDRYQSTEELADACRSFLKDLAEDTRIMLAELYAAHSSVKAVATQPGATEITVQLLQDIQKLMAGERQADYASLDRLMNILLEQSPVIRAAGGAMPTVDYEEAQHPPEDAQTACPDETGQIAPQSPAAAESPAGAGLTLPGQELQNNHTAARRSEIFKETGLKSMESSESSHAQADTSVPEPQTAPAPPATAIPQKVAIDVKSRPAIVLPAEAALQNSKLREEMLAASRINMEKRQQRISKAFHRTAAAIFLLLAIAAAACLYWGIGLSAAEGFLKKSKIFSSQPVANAVAFIRGESGHDTVKAASVDSLELLDTPMPAGGGLAYTNEPAQPLTGEEAGSLLVKPSTQSISRVSRLIRGGKLQLAKEELDKLQKQYPGSASVFALRRQLLQRESAAAAERGAKGQEQLTAVRKQQDAEWDRQVSGLFANGKYTEVDKALTLWSAENPENPNARDFSSRLAEIQRNLKSYAAAMSENRYQEAINAIGNAERINPSDPNLTELRRQAEARKANARASLIVHRLGPKGILFMDGQPLSNDGEVENENIPIGSHLLTIENGGSVVVSRRQEFHEGQRIVLVHDLDRQYLRAINESDRELIAQRKTMEEVRSFDVEHLHGTFRGSCRGTLAVDYLDIAFKPSSGYHGFRIPFKLLKISINGKTVNLLNASDDSSFQSFKFRNDQSASKFRQSWDELKSFARQVAENK